MTTTTPRPTTDQGRASRAWKKVEAILIDQVSQTLLCEPTPPQRLRLRRLEAAPLRSTRFPDPDRPIVNRRPWPARPSEGPRHGVINLDMLIDLVWPAPGCPTQDR